MSALRDNYAYIEGENIQDITYVHNSASVSEGQPVDTPPTIHKKGSQFVILLPAGRHKSKPVADGFTQESGGKGHMFTPFTMHDTQPEELNFYFGLKIHWKNGEVVDVYLGQGSTMSRNNWWIGATVIEATEGHASIKVGKETFKLTGYDAPVSAAERVVQTSAENDAGEVEMQGGIPPALVWLIKVVGEKVAKELVKLITANVNSFRVTQ